MAVIVVLLVIAASVTGITLSSNGPRSRAYQAGFTYGEYQEITTLEQTLCNPSQVPGLTWKGSNRDQFQQGCEDGYTVGEQAINNPTSPLPVDFPLPYNRLARLCLSASEMSSIIGQRVAARIFSLNPILPGASPRLGGNCVYESPMAPSANPPVEIAFAADSPSIITESCSESALTTGQTFPKHCTTQRYSSGYIYEQHLAMSPGIEVIEVGGIGQAAFFKENELVVARRPELIIVLGPTSLPVSETIARQVLSRVDRAVV